MNRKIVLDHRKANPFNLAPRAWFYVSRSGRTIELYTQSEKGGEVLKVKIPLKVIDELQK